MSIAEQRLPRDEAVLILEDDGGLAQLLGSVIEWTFEVVAVCGDVDDALGEVQNGVFDVLVVDVGLRGKSGINFLRAARAAGCTAPAVIITGLADGLSETSIRGLGVETVLRKPFPLEALEAALDDITAPASEIA